MLRVPKLILFIFCTNSLLAQLPETDLWLFKIKNSKNILTLEDGKNITSRKGYDNQPFFTPDNKSVLYVSIREDKQADIYKYDISKEISLQLTKTKESEYSPIYTPDEKSFSCVVVEADSSQRLWLYNLDGTVKKCYHQGIDSIGYYTWLSNDTILYYKLTNPHSLRMYCDKSKEDKWLCNMPTRAFKKLSGNLFIYGIKDSLQVQYRMYNTVIKRSEEFCMHKSNSEDFVWNKAFGLIKSEGAQLLQYNEKIKIWNVLFDFSSYGIKKITRFTFDKNNKYIVVTDNT